MSHDQSGDPRLNVPQSENINAVEMHGCIVCAKIHTVVAVYTSDGRLVGCAVTSPGGHWVPDEHHALVACDVHTREEIDAAYQRWQLIIKKGFDETQEDD